MKRTPAEERIHTAKNVAQVILAEAEVKALAVKESAAAFDKAKIALAAVEASKEVQHARETARQMLLKTNLDVSQIPRICDNISTINVELKLIRSNMAEMKIAQEIRTTDIGWLKLGMIGIMSVLSALTVAVIVALISIGKL